MGNALPRRSLSSGLSPSPGVLHFHSSGDLEMKTALGNVQMKALRSST